MHNRFLASALAIAALAPALVAAHASDVAAITGPTPGAIITDDTLVLSAYDASDTIADAEGAPVGRNIVDWAVRPDCARGTGDLVAGSVSGFSDPYTYADEDGVAHFEATIDLTGVAPGQYCFIVNPRDTATRLFATFFVVDTWVEVGGNVVLDDSRDGRFTHALDGLVADAGDAGIVGTVTVNHRDGQPYRVYEAAGLAFRDARGIGVSDPKAVAVITGTDGEKLYVLDRDASEDYPRGAVVIRPEGAPSTAGDDVDGSAGRTGADSWVDLVRGNAHVVVAD